MAEGVSRNMSPLAVGAVLLGALSVARVHSARAQDVVSAAESAARAGAETPDGKKFGEDLGKVFGREHGATIQRCAKETKRPDLSDFDLLLRVDGIGLVDQALVKPATNLAQCVRHKMKGWKTSVPPNSGFWVKVSVNLKRK